MRKLLWFLGALLACLIAYLALWPVSVRPVAWEVSENPGYTNAFAPNDRLSSLDLVGLDGRLGPEDADIGPDGLVYVASHKGEILRIEADRSITPFAQTSGRPLGIEFADDGTLYVADAYLGLLSIDRTGQVTLLANEADDESPILYADDVDIAADGAVYFSDASTRFGAEANGGTLPASVLDLVEHSGNGRILKYDPATGKTTVFAQGLNFANGVAVNEASNAVFVVETGAYRIWRFPLDGSPGEVVLDNLPGFPDNINNAAGGTFWVGLVSPRNAIMDNLAGNPFLRQVIMRLPDAMKPAPTRYGLIFRMDAAGRVIETFQDPAGRYALTTGAVSLPDGHIAVTSLTEPALGLLKISSDN
ncbi:SMP-30/gluconolactonase/LRE family protein [Sulfitobacter mediterraneus]|uniref:Sugar lactone lactonase YvrE n=1 Tax=Sulfitobacter mediterraneus TaxID=83219 RepID=A0A2T6CBL2_9RHOB|nr:SMP-30/gluconolactonase/LRE family protein [Sulfitobacter mediterraneus]KIN77091.1 Strictosidine synthase family protein [Sulfitobacter mediterraneus KCTC 32188]PTX72896.1 sugar lactone lactonase YvrE [Sulfitobacter mediterraneus]